MFNIIVLIQYIYKQEADKSLKTDFGRQYHNDFNLSQEISRSPFYRYIFALFFEIFV